MTVSLIDLRELSNPSKEQLSSLVEQHDAHIVIVVGHGTPNSVGSRKYGFTAETFPHFPSAKVIWLYACNCGTALITEIAKRGVTAFGYITNVLAPATVESSVAHHIKNIVERYSGDISPSALLSYVQEELFNNASTLLESASDQTNGLFLFQASLINHTRLSLRFATTPCQA